MKDVMERHRERVGGCRMQEVAKDLSNIEPLIAY